MAYITWEYYSSLYENVTEEEFNILSVRAEKKINLYTHMRVTLFTDSYDEETATDFEKMVLDAIQITMCELINKMSMQEASGARDGLTSISNDGYSESYKITTQAEKEAELRAVVMAGLSGTGLVSAL